VLHVKGTTLKTVGNLMVFFCNFPFIFLFKKKHKLKITPNNII